LAEAIWILVDKTHSNETEKIPWTLNQISTISSHGDASFQRTPQWALPKAAPSEESNPVRLTTSHNEDENKKYARAFKTLLQMEKTIPFAVGASDKAIISHRKGVIAAAAS